MEGTKDTHNEHNWRIYTGKGKPQPEEVTFPKPPPWRTFKSNSEDPRGERTLARGEEFQIDDPEIDLVNAALILRRPLLVTGKPGSGKSSLAYSVARELKLEPVLRWPITSRTTLSDGLYYYDAIGRLQNASMQEQQAKQKASSLRENEKNEPDIGEYIHLGPLGNAFISSEKPRVLLIDEIDKCDIDLPNDLLNIFEEGEFEIRELRRMASKGMSPMEVFTDKNSRVPIPEGLVRCNAFPFVVLTSNGEREFPPAFLRRCIQLKIEPPDDPAKLLKIVQAHLTSVSSDEANELIKLFRERSKQGHLAVDQLLNLIYLATLGVDVDKKDALQKAILHHLSNTGMA